jgi:DNA-binding GntR family transcriptional regulator
MLPWLTEASPDRFADVRDTSLVRLVHGDLLSQILRGALSPGQRINEPDVAGRLQVSRVPVREALRELESSGLVISRKHAGVFVRHLGAEEIQALYGFRSLLDGFAGRSAAALATGPRSALATDLDMLVNAMRDAAARHDVQAYYPLNLRFHWALIEATGNSPLVETYRGIVQKLHLSRLKNLSQDLGMLASNAEHERIVAALHSGDAARCEALMAQHVSDAHGRLVNAAQAATDNARTA